MSATARPDLYTDHNVSLRLTDRLRTRGFAVTTTRDLGLERATDAQQVLVAAERGWLLLTHNERDYVLLFDAWRRWSEAWRVFPRHAGIVVLPQREPAVTEALFLALVAETPDFVGSLYRWHSGRGWSRFEYTT
ncbi:MAG: DUF5615 family PIN-like protein [Chloroflexota bacterium]|nr:DUF5615 family PIN-like protein [Chloroflexota bacterium]